MNKTFLLNMYTSNDGTYFKIRPSTIYSNAPMFYFSDRNPKGIPVRQAALVSFPMFTKYTGFTSVKDVKYERLVFKMKPEYQSGEQQ
jgi:hypothetical protein